jgi:hypothetical protein
MSFTHLKEAFGYISGRGEIPCLQGREALCSVEKSQGNLVDRLLLDLC